MDEEFYKLSKKHMIFVEKYLAIGRS